MRAYRVSFNYFSKSINVVIVGSIRLLIVMDDKDAIRWFSTMRFKVAVSFDSFDVEVY